MLAHTFLAVLAHRHRTRKRGPAAAETTATTPEGNQAQDTPTASVPMPTPPPAPRRHPVLPSLPEIRGLFNRRAQGKSRIHQALHWSTWRREHQGEARWHHTRRRLKLQTAMA